MYPNYIEVENKKYLIDTDYRTALACFEAINDETIGDVERMVAVVTMLLGKEFPFELMLKAMDKCAIYLRCGKTENQDISEIDMDYEQDKSYITASFRSCYQIDINKEKMHWWEYNDLIEGFKEDDIMTRVRSIRNANPNDIKDATERNRLIEMQNKLALKERKTTKQKEIDKMWEELLKEE